jgi:hypothetical protein
MTDPFLFPFPLQNQRVRPSGYLSKIKSAMLEALQNKQLPDWQVAQGILADK